MKKIILLLLISICFIDSFSKSWDNLAISTDTLILKPRTDPTNPDPTINGGNRSPIQFISVIQTDLQLDFGISYSGYTVSLYDPLNFLVFSSEVDNNGYTILSDNLSGYYEIRLMLSNGIFVGIIEM